jgi:hypothetical protein
MSIFRRIKEKRGRVHIISNKPRCLKMQPWWKEAKLRGGCSYRFLGPQRRKSGFTYIAAGYIMRDACLQEGKGPDHCLFGIPWRSRSRLAITLRR